MSKKNINFVVENNLCTMCGTCAGICTENAINMELNYSKGIYVPIIDGFLCNECGLCVQCCPGFKVDINKYRINRKDDLQIHPLFGAYNGIFRAYSTNDYIRKRGASGGMITSILRYLFSEKLIDAAIVTKMDQNDPIDVVPYIAYNENDLFQSQKSKYAPTALNTILKKCLSDECEGKRLAYVGLPCHIEGLRLAQQQYLKLTKRIVVTLSLFCHHMPSRRATEFLMYKNNIQFEDLKHIDYRGNGKPGRLRFLLKDNREIFVHHLHWTYWGCAFLNFFIPVRCWLCYDKTGEMADFSVGDNWQKYKIDMKGAATVITRSRQAIELLQNMFQKGYIEKSDMSVEELIRDQDLRNVNNISPRLDLWKLLGRKIPLYDNLILKRKIHVKELIPAFRIMICNFHISFPIIDNIIKIFYTQQIVYKKIKNFKNKVIRKIKSIFKKIKK